MALSIHDAAKQGNLEEVTRLIQEDPEILDSVNGSGSTALHYASAYGHVEVVSYLLDQGANIDKKDLDDGTALMNACGSGHLEVVKLLLSWGADPTICDIAGWTPLMVASYGRHVDVVRCLVRNKAVKAIIDTQDNNGRTALFRASSRNRTEMVKLLVEVGANPMVADKEDDTPLNIAKNRGHNDCFTILEVSPRQ